MNIPEWLTTELATASEKNAARQITRHAAVSQVRDAIMAHDDQVFIRGLVADYAAKALAAWNRENSRRGAGAELVVGQSELFPGLSTRLYIRPGQAKAVILFTGHDWDTARAMLATRTQGSIQAAQADWAAFEAAYQRARPLLRDDMVTADIAFELQHPAEAVGT